MSNSEIFETLIQATKSAGTESGRLQKNNLTLDRETEKLLATVQPIMEAQVTPFIQWLKEKTLIADAERMFELIKKAGPMLINIGQQLQKLPHDNPKVKFCIEKLGFFLETLGKCLNYLSEKLKTGINAISNQMSALGKKIQGSDFIKGFTETWKESLESAAKTANQLITTFGLAAPRPTHQ